MTGILIAIGVLFLCAVAIAWDMYYENITDEELCEHHGIYHRRDQVCEMCYQEEMSEIENMS